LLAGISVAVVIGQFEISDHDGHPNVTLPEVLREKLVMVKAGAAGACKSPAMSKTSAPAGVIAVPANPTSLAGRK
jgi:hypothetical protein